MENVNLWTDGAEIERNSELRTIHDENTKLDKSDKSLLKVDARKRVVDADSWKAVAELTRSRNQTWAGHFPPSDVISVQTRWCKFRTRPFLIPQKPIVFQPFSF